VKGFIVLYGNLIGIIIFMFLWFPPRTMIQHKLNTHTAMISVCTIKQENVLFSSILYRTMERVYKTVFIIILV